MNMISIIGSYALSVIKGVAAFTLFPVYEMSHQQLLLTTQKQNLPHSLCREAGFLNFFSC